MGRKQRFHPVGGVLMMRFAIVLFALIFSVIVIGCGGEQETRAPASPAEKDAKSALIDINRASAADLMTLKGIGEARAKAIIRGRPYARKDDLVQRQIIPQSVYDKIKDKIIARQN
jgi:DNA uptake protein ComE-like DNA-binding protein